MSIQKLGNREDWAEEISSLTHISKCLSLGKSKKITQKSDCYNKKGKATDTSLTCVGISALSLGNLRLIISELFPGLYVRDNAKFPSQNKNEELYVKSLVQAQGQVDHP